MILEKDIREITRSAVLLKELADLYYLTFNERMKVGCGSCYVTAYNKLKSYIYKDKINTMESKKENNCNFELSVSNIRKHNSTEIHTNETLTDEIAISYLKQNKARIVHFKKFPEDWEELLVTKKPRKKRATKKVEKKEDK